MKNRAEHRRRAGVAALTAFALAAAIGPAGASAAPSSVTVQEFDFEGPHGYVTANAPGGDRARHLMSVTEEAPGSYLITDSAGIQIAPAEKPAHEQQQKCSAVNPYAVRCGLPEGYTEGIMQLIGARAADVLDVREAGIAVTGFLGGQGGDDRVLGGAADDDLFGGSGDDVLIGYRGNDTLSGNGGIDVLRSRDGLRDEITCGAGDNRREKAIRDRFDRPYSFEYGGSTVKTFPISC
jgi:hypothetical protein